MAFVMDCTKNPFGKDDQAGSTPSFGCAASYSGFSGGCGLKLPESGNVLAPWVAITFVDATNNQSNNNIITVGNQSSTLTDPANLAIIQHFEIGYSDGMELRVTIHDAQGGAFEQFMSHLLKDWACLKDDSSTPAAIEMRVQFGWAKSGCNTPFPTAVSPCYYAIVISVEANLADGKFIFDIVGQDYIRKIMTSTTEVCIGGEGDQGEYLTVAIRNMLTGKEDPRVGKVTFKKIQGGTVVTDGTEGAILFKGNTPEEQRMGPRTKFTAQGLDKINAALQWLGENAAVDGTGRKGWIVQYNGTGPNGEIVFWVDPTPYCSIRSDAEWDANCIGTYIVGGGSASPVLEFNPKIKWDFFPLTAAGGSFGAGRADSMQTDGSKNPGLDCPGLGRKDNPGAGSRTQNTPSDGAIDVSGPLNAGKATALSEAQQKRSMRSVIHDIIEADLVIIGDPAVIPDESVILSKNISIILINPFAIIPNGSSCGDWLADPMCHPTLSNKGWICKSCTHKIEPGRFTTTLGVRLTVPGIDVPPDYPLGASESGWKPPIVC